MHRNHQIAYWQMLFHAEFYLWCALRGFALPGNGPYGHGMKSYHDKQASREAYKAMARYWIKEARAYRRAHAE